MKRFNKILHIVLIALLITLLPGVYAQNANRLASTKIVDALNQLPANSQELYNRLMSDISSTEEEGLNLLMTMLQKNDASLEKVQYAINGYVAYAAADDFDSAKRDLLIKVIDNAVKDINSRLSGDPKKDISENPAMVSNKEFLQRQLMILGQRKPEISSTPVLSKEEATSALKSASALVKKASNYKNKAIYVSAVRDYIQAYGVTDGEKFILNGLKNKDKEYRFAIINAVNDFANKDEIQNLVSKIVPSISKYGDESKVDILYFLGNHPELVESSYLIPLLQSKNKDVTAATAWTITKIGKKDDVQAITSLLASDDDTIVALAESCLKCYKTDLSSSIKNILPQLNTSGIVSAMNVIGERKDRQNADLVLKSLSSDDGKVKSAAYNALSKIAQQQDLEMLYKFLENSEPQYIPDIQNGINTALLTVPEAERYNIISNQKNKASADKQNLYWPMILKNADGLKLLDICRQFKNSDDSQLKDLAFQSYMNSISAKLPGAQRLLLYRNGMEFAETISQKRQVLNKIATTETFLGAIFSGRYLDDPDLAQAAAGAIRTIACTNKNVYGPEVIQLLKKSQEIITGDDAEYQKTEIQNRLNEITKNGDEGYVSIFNGKNLDGWKGLLAAPYDNPYKRALLGAKELEKAQKEADEAMLQSWSVVDGNIVFNGKGRSLCTQKKYGNFEMYVDWKLAEGREPDAGIYLRGTPQVQIWDTSRVASGAQVGSGGLYNNKVNRSIPLIVADNGLGQWNSFYIKMVGERVTVYLNGELVVDNVIMENYWDRNLPILLKEQIELQAHGSVVSYRDIYIHELPYVEPYKLSKEEEKEGFKLLFDGTNLHNWQGDIVNYVPEDGTIAVRPRGQGFGNLYTKEEYGDFIFRFEFKLTPGANNGVGIRAEMNKDAAYYGMEIQILDHFNEIYQPGLQDYQYHGSVYGIIPTQDQNQLKPVGEWNVEEIYVKGNHIKVTLNGVVITEGDIAEATKNGTYDHKDHPGLFNKKGYIGFLGHGSILWLRNVRVKRLD